ncbi:MAG: hypothetical protein AAF467_24660 [Actinomycetota bacterium]
MRIPIDDDRFNANVLGATAYEPVLDFETGEHKVTEDGRAWLVHIAYHDKDDPYAVPVQKQVRLRSKADPNIAFAPIWFGGLSALEWEMPQAKNGQAVMKSGLSLSASGFTQEAPPSQKRATPPAPVEAKASK